MLPRLRSVSLLKSNTKRVNSAGSSILLVLAIVGATLLFPAGNSLLAQDVNVFHRGNGAEPDSLDPHKASGTWENNIIGDLFVGLMTDDIHANAIPGAAESWVISEDGLTYTFAIRKDHVWSDGVPVTAYDFEFALRRILNPVTAAQYASLLYVIKDAAPVNSGQIPVEELGVRALDDRTLEITLENPAPFFLQLLTHYTTFPVPKHIVELHGDAWIKPQNVVSNGAYVLKDWRPNDHVRTEKNPLFYDAANVQIQNVIFYPTPESTAALKRFRAGEIDLNNDFPAEQIEWLRENYPNETRIAPYMGVSYIIFNTQSPPFDRPKVRMALSMLLERHLITDKVRRVGEIPAFSFIPPGVSNYGDGPEMFFKDLPREERIEIARRLLKEEGFDDRNPLQFIYRHRENRDLRRSATVTRKLWQEAGVRADLLQTEVKVHYNDLRTGNFAVADAGWIADYNDAQNFFFLLQSSSGQMNYGKYNNLEFDNLMDQAAQTMDLEERAAILRQSEQIVLDEMPLVPVFFSVSKSLVHTYVRGWEDNVVNIHRTRYISIDRNS